MHYINPLFLFQAQMSKCAIHLERFIVHSLPCERISPYVTHWLVSTTHIGIVGEHGMVTRHRRSPVLKVH